MKKGTPFKQGEPVYKANRKGKIETWVVLGYKTPLFGILMAKCQNTKKPGQVEWIGAHRLAKTPQEATKKRRNEVA